MTRLQDPASVRPMRVYRLHGDIFEPVNEGELKLLLADPTNSLWIDMDGPSPYHQSVMRDVFHFHPLAIEDTLNGRQRPKIEEYADHLFAIVNAIGREDDEERSIAFREIDIFVGSNYLVTVHDGPEPCIEAALERCTTPGRAVNGEMSVSFAFYAVIDRVIDDYFPIVDDIGDEIDSISERILERPHQSELKRLYNLKRGLAEIWRVTGQQRDMFLILNRYDRLLDRSGRLAYHLRDVLDHVIRISDMVSTYRDMLASVVELYMSSFSNRLNITVKRLTVLTLTIGILTLISGFYGMNFAQTWPDFDNPLGVPITIGMMILGVSSVLLYIRRLD